MTGIGAWRARRDDQSGLGLAELIVAMALLAVLMTMVVAAFTAFSRNFTRDQASTDSANVAVVGMNEVTRVIRSGTPNPVLNQPQPDTVFQTANNETVVLYAYLDTNATTPAPVKVQFSVNATTRELTETRWKAKPLTPGYWAFEDNPLWSRVIARKIVTIGSALPDGGTAAPLFQFYNSSGTRLVPGSSGVAATSLRDIAAVEVSMTVQADASGRADPVTINNRVGIPNLGVPRVGI